MIWGQLDPGFRSKG